MHTKTLYFKGATEDALPELQQLFKSCRGIRLNVDPHDFLEIAGNVEFRNVHDTEKAMAVLNNRRLKENNGTLIMSPLPNAEIGPPPTGGYVFIKHIPEDATETSLYDFLRPSGPLYSCSIPTHSTDKRKGTANACFVDISYAHAAVEQLNFAEFLGNTISIQLSRSPRLSRANTSASNRSANSESESKYIADLDMQTKGPQQQQHIPSAEPELESRQRSPSLSSQDHQLAQSPTTLIQNRQSATSPNGLGDGPGSGLGGVIVPGKLFVTNLHPTVSHKEMFALFKKYGYILSARVSIDSLAKKSRGHGIVQYSDPAAALAALKECQGADIKGRKITVYQYEHVNKQHSASSSASVSTSPPPIEGLHGRGSPSPQLHQQPEATTNTMPFPRSSSAASTHASNPLLDPTMLRKLSEGSRNEILKQRLLSEISLNPAIDARDSTRIAECFIKRPLEDILALLSDPGQLASEWDLEQRVNMRLAFQHVDLGSPVSQSPSPSTHAADIGETYSIANGGASAQRESAGICVQDYDTETEEYIEMLISMPENERKKKLGSKLFPLIKGMGYKESTKLTVWILEHMSHDVRTLAYTLNDSGKLRLVVNEAQRAISGLR
ncbi:hypothetical protein COEREDRAFT_78242 [Coemansia reversa NRRL 1564]|uniref:RRM domain-containing protein n=1 Tax=Coemansia reversa (strain ATCC 12441 / NRRL 1564) TaxID=763665 RepID=A0A2G5B202_COERN|nr:hypothetical protein COEREDRAFT_78242 [Coemansia reversa NRRL 1564]|eukprot:PIA13050.1 hypothetical protein COEREDRAFT_78242 [Coemansia reversa NRRL 1564]